MKNFRVGNIIEVNGHLTAIYECCNDLIWFYDNKGNVDFLKIYDERIKDVELSNFLLDKMFKEELKAGFDNFYFRGRMGRDLDRAKKYEKEVDRTIREYKEKQMDSLQLKLF